ncbi:metallophosphoesterase [Alteromonas sp. CYL-A6]|uniref:metallophosphoesterase n=1 Tax=Alteromonas nitratireducens TaxID=3390813 RepID=UPI0034AA42DC
MRLLWLAVISLLSVCSAMADSATYDPAGKIVVVGDVHGDYDRFTCVLEQAGLVNSRLRWTGENATLVQVGDIVDRGPDSRKVIDLLRGLKPMARRKGGNVFTLLGNHEAMLVAADTRYVHPGEYRAFVDRRSQRRQQQYLSVYIDHIKNTQPEDSWPDFNASDYRQGLEQQFPPGYVEYMQAWSPKGEYGAWAIANPAVLKLGRLLFVHGGMGPTTQNFTVTELNQWVHSELATREKAMLSDLLNDPDGPLWYRGHMLNVQTDTAEQERINDTLQRLQADHIIMGHTPVAGAIIPRFNNAVIGVDVGLASYYGGPCAFLEIDGDQFTAVHNGVRVPLPSAGESEDNYLQQVLSLDPDNAMLKRYLQRLAQPDTDTPAVDPDKLN